MLPGGNDHDDHHGRGDREADAWCRSPSASHYGRLFDRRDESVSAARQGLDVGGLPGIVAQGRAGLEHAEVEAALEVDEGLVTPHDLPQLFAGDQLAGTGGQRRQEAERLRRDGDDDTIAMELATVR